MAYERTNWQNGDVISSEKLNKMEAGIEYACSLEHEVEDPTEGQVLKYDAEKEKFVNGDAAIETNIQNPTDGQTLKYDAASGKWVNGEGGGSSRLLVGVNETQEGSDTVYTLDHTWQEIADAYPNVYTLRDDDGNLYYDTPFLRIEDGEYIVEINSLPYATSSATGYPSYTHATQPLG